VSFKKTNVGEHFYRKKNDQKTLLNFSAKNGVKGSVRLNVKVKKGGTH
jgi:hypothetical protein